LPFDWNSSTSYAPLYGTKSPKESNATGPETPVNVEGCVYERK